MKNNSLFRLLLLAAVCLSLAACGADIGLGKPPGTTRSVVSTDEKIKSDRLSTLPAQKLDKGECAIFLWSENVGRPLVFAQNIKTDKASLLINKAAMTLNRKEATAPVIPGFFAKQSFSNDEIYLDVRLRSEAGRNLYEGIKIPSGILTVRNPDRSENIISVSGLLGCNLDK